MTLPRSEGPLDIAILGLAITSAWGNGHATTFRALVRGLAQRGHRVTFYERDTPWYADNRDLAAVPGCRIVLYRSVEQLQALVGPTLDADVAILGSYVPDGARIAEWMLARANGLTAFYDIDTPVTVARLRRGDCAYLAREQIPRFDLYLSFAGGPILQRLRDEFGARRAEPLYCSVDAQAYFPAPTRIAYDLGYLGTYSDDRQPALDRLLLEPARRTPGARFCVAGPQYPDGVEWPANVARIEHLSPREHRPFYNSQRFTLNVTRADMVASGHSPSVRLFEAAACGVPIISDDWAGLADLFVPGEEILIARAPEDTLRYLHELGPEEAARIGAAARRRVLRFHTAERRAAELEHHVHEAAAARRERRPAPRAVHVAGAPT